MAVQVMSRTLRMTFSFLAFLTSSGLSLWLGHEFAGFEQRGLGLVLIRAFCQGQ